MMLAAAMAMGSLSACGSSSSSGQKEITTETAEASASEVEEAEETVEETETESEAVEEVAVEEETAEEESAADAGETTIEEQVLFDANDVKITATQYNEDGIWGDSLQLLVENNGDASVGIGADVLIVNDYMVANVFSSQVAAGKKANETLDLLTSELEAAGIDNVGQIEVQFHLYDPDTFETTYTGDLVTVQTNHYEDMDTTADQDGQELYNADGVKIVGKYVDEDDIWGTAIVLYLENNTDQNIVIQCDDLSINGLMIYPYFSSTIYANKKAVDEITLLETELEENGIETVEDVELVFNIINYDTFETITTSDPITFSAK